MFSNQLHVAGRVCAPGDNHGFISSKFGDFWMLLINEDIPRNSDAVRFGHFRFFWLTHTFQRIPFLRRSDHYFKTVFEICEMRDPEMPLFTVGNTVLCSALWWNSVLSKIPQVSFDIVMIVTRSVRDPFYSLIWLVDVKYFHFTEAEIGTLFDVCVPVLPTFLYRSVIRMTERLSNRIFVWFYVVMLLYDTAGVVPAY